MGRSYSIPLERTAFTGVNAYFQWTNPCSEDKMQQQEQKILKQWNKSSKIEMCIRISQDTYS